MEFKMDDFRKQNLLKKAKTNGVIKPVRQGRVRQGLARVEEIFDSVVLIIFKWDRGSTWGAY